MDVQCFVVGLLIKYSFYSHDTLTVLLFYNLLGDVLYVTVAVLVNYKYMMLLQYLYFLQAWLNK